MYWFIFKSWIRFSFSRLNVFLVVVAVTALRQLTTTSFWCLFCWCWTHSTPFFFDVSVVNFEQVNVCFERIHLENWSTRTFKIRSWFSEKRTANCFYGLASMEILFFTRLNFFVVVITCFSSCFTDFSLEMN